MSNSDCSVKLAREIANSWHRTASNYIIVAPPLSNPHALFLHLGDPVFLQSVLGDAANTIAIARLGTQDFKSELTFARRVSEKWKVSTGNVANEDDPVTLLEASTHLVLRDGRIPVILIERFHEALERLGEDIGIALRDLEHAVHLKTAVEIPVSLEVLRSRWEAMDADKVPFLRSDWGQAHTKKLLKGYSCDEVRVMTIRKGGSKAVADSLFLATGGLPELVDCLIDDAVRMDLDSFAHYAGAKAPQLCARLVKWLDKPNENLFKRLVVKSISSPNFHHGPTSLADHDWRGILVNNDGTLKCQMITWACLDKLAIDGDKTFIEPLVDSVAAGQHSDVDRLLRELSNTPVYARDTWKMLDLLNRFCKAANPFDVNWDDARAVFQEINDLGTRSLEKHVQSCAIELQAWAPLIELMCSFFHAQRNQGDIRLERFVCLESTPRKTAAFLQLLQLRLDRADSHEPFTALKSVVEQPESLLQLYSQQKLGICFWSFSGIDDSLAARIEALLNRPFVRPGIGQPLGFVELLRIVSASMENMPQQDRLISGLAEMSRLEKLYEERKRQVHSTAFVFPADWKAYRGWCQEMLDLIWRMLSINELAKDLPRPDSSFGRVAKFLIDTGASSEWASERL